MLSERQLFYEFVAQTSNSPISLDIVKAEGCYLYDRDGKRFLDLISGISVSNTGHRHPHIIDAIKKQLSKYLYLMVYGEYIQSPQVKLAEKLSSILPAPLDSVYFVNSGSEANEGALKLAKRHTGRSEIIALKNAYHGSSHGALSVMGNERFKRSFRPLLPGIRFIHLNNEQELDYITEKTACVIIEPVQGEAGVRLSEKAYLHSLKQQCQEKGALLIFDEIQTGFGRTGTMFSMDSYAVTPDIVTLAKGLGGGMPLGAFVSSKKIMSSLSNNPALGHITTFGGHPVCCSAALASIEILEKSNVVQDVNKKGDLIKKLLNHPLIKEVRGAGMLVGVELESEILTRKVIDIVINEGVIIDWFLFGPNVIRIAPPLVMSTKEIEFACNIILDALHHCKNNRSTK